MQDGNTGGFPFCNFSQVFYTPHQHGGALLEPKTDKKSIVFFEEAPGLVSIRLIPPVLTTYASKPIKVYLIKSYITQTMFCIASSRPWFIPPIITALDHAHMTDHSPND